MMQNIEHVERTYDVLFFHKHDILGELYDKLKIEERKKVSYLPDFQLFLFFFHILYWYMFLLYSGQNGPIHCPGNSRSRIYISDLSFNTKSVIIQNMLRQLLYLHGVKYE